MNTEERAVARLLSFEAIHGVECESSYGGEPVTHRFTSCSTTEMITVRCEHCGTWITESVPMRALDAVVSFKRFVGVRPVRERIDDHLDDYRNGFLVLSPAEVPLNLRWHFQGMRDRHAVDAVRQDARARRH
jgi:hypothetical protein